MKRIAARAEVSIGTVYHHFPSYEDCIRACGEYTAQLFPLPEDAILQNIDGPAERITAWCRHGFFTMNNHRTWKASAH